MSRIRQLSEGTVNRIAAGEQERRPGKVGTTFPSGRATGKT
jgi:hypothetical protein